MILAIEHEAAAVWPIWQNFANMAKFYKFMTFYFLFGKIVNLLWQICYITGLIFIVASGQILKHNLTIWSHWAAAAAADTWVWEKKFAFVEAKNIFAFGLKIFFDFKMQTEYWQPSYISAKSAVISCKVHTFKESYFANLHSASTIITATFAR